MYFQCVLILALSLVQNEAAERFFSQRSDSSRVIRPRSPKVIQASFDTAAELATLIQRVKKDYVDEKNRLQSQPIEDTSTQDETHLQGLFNVIQKKIDDNDVIRIHVLKNADVLDKYKKDLGSRAVFIDNPEVLEKYVSAVKNQKTDDTQPMTDFEKLFLQRRNAVFRLEDPSSENHFSYDTVQPKQNYEGSKDFVDPKNLQNSKLERKRSEGGISGDISKRFNKVTNEKRERKTSGKKRDAINRSREGRKEVGENRGYNNERESRYNEREEGSYKKVRESRGSDKRNFKDYSDFKSQGNPNLSRAKNTKVADYDYDRPRKPKKSAPRDYDEGFSNKKRNEDKFDDYGRDKKKGDGWGQSIGSEPRRKPVPKMNYDEKPKRNFDNNERRRPRNEDGWAPSIRGGSNDYNARSSKNNDAYSFGNTPIPFNLPRNIYVNEHGE